MNVSKTGYGPQSLVCDYCGAEVVVRAGDRPHHVGWLQFRGYLPQTRHACTNCLAGDERVGADSRACDNAYTAAKIEPAPFTGAPGATHPVVGA